MPELKTKRIVYLWGAGASQAEVSYVGDPVNLLMRDSDRFGEGISTRIIAKLPEPWRSRFTTNKGTDVEKLISLLGASNVHEHTDIAERLRKFYFEEIANDVVSTGIATNPTLAIALMSLHANADFANREALTAVVTTNHDGILQLASDKVWGSLEIGVPFQSTDVTADVSGKVPPVLQIHGSFTWTFDLPLKVSFLATTPTYSPDAVWIAPTIAKESKVYPFNKLAAVTYEKLSRECDVLRVVGSSLTQNDWNILSLIFSAQQHREYRGQGAFLIELIMPPDSCKDIKEQCSFLKNLRSIDQLSDGDFTPYQEDPGLWTDDMHNPLLFWLSQKVAFHVRAGHLDASSLSGSLAKIAGEA